MRDKYLTLLFVSLLFSNPAKSETKQEEVNEDFLAFLAEMDEVTGDGFEQWIDDESVDSKNNIEEHKHQNTNIEKQDE